MTLAPIFGKPSKANAASADNSSPIAISDDSEEEEKELTEEEKEAQRVRREFLLSGVPQALRKQQQCVQSITVCDYVPLPRVSHVQQIPQPHVTSDLSEQASLSVVAGADGATAPQQVPEHATSDSSEHITKPQMAESEDAQESCELMETDNKGDPDNKTSSRVTEQQVCDDPESTSERVTKQQVTESEDAQDSCELMETDIKGDPDKTSSKETEPQICDDPESTSEHVTKPQVTESRDEQGSSQPMETGIKSDPDDKTSTNITEKQMCDHPESTDSQEDQANVTPVDREKPGASSDIVPASTINPAGSGPQGVKPPIRPCFRCSIDPWNLPEPKLPSLRDWPSTTDAHISAAETALGNLLHMDLDTKPVHLQVSCITRNL